MRPLQPARPPRPRLAATAIALLLMLAGAAQAALHVVDDFAAPAAPAFSVLAGIGERSFGQAAPVDGGVRDVYHHVYANPLDSVSALAVGNGILSSSDGVGVTSEVVVSWGAFTRPGGDPLQAGPRLALDWRGHDAFAIDFQAATKPLNLVVTLYTAAPLDLASALPSYYTTVGVNVAPPAGGGPLSVLLPFAASPGFNFAQVDGVALLINRAVGNVTQNAYNLDRLAVVSSVPDAPAPLLLLSGLGALCWLARWRRLVHGPLR